MVTSDWRHICVEPTLPHCVREWVIHQWRYSFWKPTHASLWQPHNLNIAKQNERYLCTRTVVYQLFKFSFFFLLILDWERKLQNKRIGNQTVEFYKFRRIQFHENPTRKHRWVVHCWVKITQDKSEIFFFQIWKLYKKIKLNFVFYNLIIGCSEKDCLKKAPEWRNKETRNN